MTAKEWLQTPLKNGNGTILTRLAELVEVNGGLKVHGWGFISSGGPYGRHGLEQDEALDLLFMGGVLEGLFIASDGAQTEEAVMIIKAEIDRVIKAQEAELANLREGAEPA